MNKAEFIASLEASLKGLPQKDIDERIAFYGEMIDDRIEEGVSEEAAVEEIGPVKEIVAQILDSTPLFKLVKENIKPKRKPNIFIIVLLILGSPVWLAVLISLLAIILSVYISLWSVVISFFAIFISLVASFLGLFIGSIFSLVTGKALVALIILGVALICAGLGIFFFFIFKLSVKILIFITKKCTTGIKSLFIRKGDKNE